jgi:hypothetical protein
VLSPHDLTLALRLVCAAAVLASTGCAQPDEAQSATAALAGALRVPATTITVRAESSRVAPGVSYYWGLYRDPQIADSRQFALVAAHQGRTRLLSSPEQWSAFGLLSLVRSLNEASAAAVCAEVVRVVGPRRDPVLQPRQFRDTTSLRGVALYSLELLRKVRLTGPRSEPIGTGDWRVTFWAVEAGRSTLYRCELRLPNSVTLAAVDSVMGGGLPDFRGP